MLPDPENGIHEVLVDRTGMIWLAEHSGTQPSNEQRLLGFNPKTEKFEHLINLDPDNVVRDEIKWTQSIALRFQEQYLRGLDHGRGLEQIRPETKKVTVFTVPTINAIVYGVVADQKRQHLDRAGGLRQHREVRHAHERVDRFIPPTYPAQIRRLNVDAQQQHLVWPVFGGQAPGKLVKLDRQRAR